MSEAVVGSMNQILINIAHSFLFIYTDFKRPCAGRGTKSRIKTIVNKIEGFNLDHFLKPDDDVNHDDDKSKKNKTKSKPKIYDLQNSVKTINGLFSEAICPTVKKKGAFLLV